MSFATGWMMVLAYFIVCPWEAVAVGRIAGYIFPQLNSVPLYAIASKPVYLPHLLLGLGLTALLTVLNYRGIRLSASFQNWTAFGTLARGSRENFPPLFTGSGSLISIFLVMQIVPYFMTGFESVAKAAEEAGPDFRSTQFFKAITMAIAVGVLFYTLVIAAVAYAAPWKSLTSVPFMTAVAFQRSVGSRWIVDVIMAAALLSLLKCFNGNFVAASRLLFALGRRGFIDERLATIHVHKRTPSVAVVWTGLVTAACMFLGQAILIPVTEVGSVASATGWTAACAAYYAMRPSPGKRAIAALGVMVGLSMISMKVIPALPGHFSRYEWSALSIWILLGVCLHMREKALAQAAGSR
jgi:amino acid transporter